MHMPGSDSFQASGILRLPAEVLSLCFAPLAEARGADPWRTHTQDCFTFSHVCRLWRTTALEDADLWTRPLVSHSEECTAQMLTRSGQRPLRVEIRDWPTRSRRAEKLVLKQMHRVTSLVLEPWRSRHPVDGRYVIKEVRQLPVAPLLTTLRFVNLDIGPYIGTQIIPSVVANLKSLVLYNCRPLEGVNVVLCILPKLEELDITVHDVGSRMGIDELADILKNLPALITLKLNNAFHLGVRRPIAKFDLPNLGLVDIRGPTNCTAQLLTHFTTVSSELKVLHTSQTEDEYLMIRGTQEIAKVSPPGLLQFTNVAIRSNAKFIAFDGRDLSPAGNETGISLGFDNCKNNNHHASLLGACLQMPFGCLQTLYLDWSGLRNVVPDCAASFSRSPALHTIRLRADACADFIVGFDIRASDPAAFPALRELSLIDADLHNCEGESQQPIPILLQGALQARSPRRLKVLHISTQDDFILEWEESLQELVDRLEVERQ